LFKEANLYTHFADLELEWAALASLMTELTEPARDESLTNACLQPDRYIRISLSKQPLKIPIDAFLPPASVKLIESRQLGGLNQVYHNLMADNDMQKVSLL
jgi:hypothetical protein